MGLAAVFPAGPRRAPLAPLLAFLALLCWLPTAAAAQDRVILFETTTTPGGIALTREIREIEVRQGGRVWTTIRTVELPPHRSSRAVALADGSAVVWLAQSGASTLLVHYDVATARASIVDIGRFDLFASLLADPVIPRVFVVEARRVIVLDARLQRQVIELPQTGGIQFPSHGYVSERYLVLQFVDPSGSFPSQEALVIDTRTNTIAGNIPLRNWGAHALSRDGRLYASVRIGTSDGIQILALPSGNVLASTATPIRPSALLQVDETRNLVIYDKDVFSSPAEQHGLLFRDATTLGLIGEFAPGVFNSRRDFAWYQTFRERTILVFSREVTVGSCSTTTPRLDVFDGTTLELVNRIDLQGRCLQIVPIPSR